MKRAWRNRHLQIVREVQEEKGSGVQRKDKQPLSPLVHGEDDVLRAVSDDDMVS
jgi:hypothetical protein